MAWSQNKVVFVGVDLYVLDQSSLVLVRPSASIYSASPLKHHATGRQ